jgi:hypothetical protein
MQVCTVCRASSPDTASHCARCGSELAIHSETAVALARLRSNPRVGRIRLIVAADSCPACEQAEGEFPKDMVPALPVLGCSHRLGCRCFYEPALVDIFP